MIEEEISTDGLIHIYCSKKTNPHDFHGKVQPEVTIEVIPLITVIFKR